MLGNVFHGEIADPHQQDTADDCGDDAPGTPALFFEHLRSPVTDLHFHARFLLFGMLMTDSDKRNAGFEPEQRQRHQSQIYQGNG